LLPTRWLPSAGMACGWDLFALKRRFTSASHELIVRRMLEFEPPIVVSIFDHGAISFRQGNRGGRLALTPLKRECWRTVHESGEFIERSGAGCTVRGWPVHEEGWKRELLRLVLVDEPEMWCGEEAMICDE
jgi:hypothetical protein